MTLVTVASLKDETAPPKCSLRFTPMQRRAACALSQGQSRWLCPPLNCVRWPELLSPTTPKRPGSCLLAIVSREYTANTVGSDTSLAPPIAATPYLPVRHSHGAMNTCSGFPMKPPPQPRSNTRTAMTFSPSFSNAAGMV